VEAAVNYTFKKLPGGGYVLELPDDAVRLELRHLRRQWHHLHCEIDVRCEWAGARTFLGSLVCTTDVDLSSQASRKGIAKHCEQRAHAQPEDFDWQWAIDAAATMAIEAERGGDDLITLDDAPATITQNHEIDGLTIAADATTMLIAHGDSLKSMVTLYTLGRLAQRGKNALYCDWEWTAERHKARKRRLFGDERLEGLKYRKLTAPLEVELDKIRRDCDLYKIDTIAIDSVGLASSGKLADDDTAIRFHRALSNLPPAICAAHVPRSAVIDKKAEPDAFGSVFFKNLSRIAWAIRKQTTGSEDVVVVGAFPCKQNDGARLRPVGLEFTFTDERIAVCSANLASVEGLADRLPLSTRIAHLLKRGPLTLHELATELDAKQDSIIKAVKRNDRFTKVVEASSGVTRIALLERGAA
jgi:hypothetical protein